MINNSENFSKDLVKSILIHGLIVVSVVAVAWLENTSLFEPSPMVAALRSQQSNKVAGASQGSGASNLQPLLANNQNPVQASLINKEVITAAIKRQELAAQEQVSKAKKLQQQEQQLLQVKKATEQDSVKLKQAMDKVKQEADRAKQEADRAKQEREQIKKQQEELQQTAEKLKQQAKDLKLQQDKIAKEKLQLSQQVLEKKKISAGSNQLNSVKNQDPVKNQVNNSDAITNTDKKLPINHSNPNHYANNDDPGVGVNGMGSKQQLNDSNANNDANGGYAAGSLDGEGTKQQFIENEISNYKYQWKREIGNNRKRLTSVPGDIYCSFKIKLLSNGKLALVKLEKSSGNIAYDTFAEQAIYKSEPFAMPSDPAIAKELTEIEHIIEFDNSLLYAEN